MTREEAIKRFNGIINAMSISIAQSKFYPSKAELDELCNMAIEALSADRPNGEWEFVDNEIFAGEYFCSVCGKRAEVDLYGEWILSNFCPSCGAIMKGGGDE